MKAPWDERTSLSTNEHVDAHDGKNIYLYSTTSRYAERLALYPGTSGASLIDIHEAGTLPHLTSI
jgi:hypothetical protein